ncbi:MAG TPA: T9SS type A sorting domain-containing protein [Chitinophagaceae bacterium]|nr:T9SS type A sorting domain-containing protein [Chitinophagaceae bacterium]
MFKKFTLFALAILCSFSLYAQYYQIPYPSIGQNPGGLNTEDEYPVGGGIPAGWTTLLGPNANPTWSNTATIPFNFSFNGVVSTQFKVSNSGCLTFDLAAATAPGFSAVTIPNATIPNNSICALGIRGIGTNDNVVTKTFGTAPNRQFWVTFSSYSNANANEWFYYSIVLEETSDKIYIVDQRASGTAAMSLGVQINNALGWNVAGAPNMPSLSTGDPSPIDNSYYAFIPGTQPQYDLTVKSITTNPFLVAGNTNITGVIRNLGTATITSFDLNYKIDNGATVTAPITGVNIASLTTYNFTHPTQWNATIGQHTVDVWATNLNGNNPDANPADDHKTSSIGVLSENVQRLPLYEIFTSSTCPPCKPGNENFHTIISGKPANDFVYIKYQEDFPGTGDPYATTESVNRRNYYAINTIPRMEIDGGWDGNANSFTNTEYNQSRLVPAYFKLEGNYKVDNKTVNTKVKFSPLTTVVNGVKLHVAILEGTTSLNKKSNNENYFYQVMKKMVPNENGTAISPNLTVGNWDSLSLSYTFNGNYRLPSDGQPANVIKHATEHSVEEFTDLMAIAWIQGPDKVVYQAVNLTSLVPVGVEDFTATIKDIQVYPNPAQDIMNIQIDAKANEKIIATLVDLNGNIINASSHSIQQGANTITINTKGIANGIYHLMLIDSRNNSSVHKIVIQH